MKIPNSETISISSGMIEYASVGNGIPILVSHGTLGGCDQALAIASLFDQERFNFLAVSRAGYLRSDAETGLNPQIQAASYAELLDHLGISSAAMLGLSGGATSALHFAPLHPHRCSALVLLSSISSAPPPLPPFFRLAVRTQDFTMRFDLLWSLVFRYGLPLLVLSNAVNSAQAKQLMQDPLQSSVIEGIYRPIATSSKRREGVRLDGLTIESLPEKPQYTIAVPTLISHAANDPLAPFHAAERLAADIPDAQFFPFPDGGHVFFVVHHQQLIPRIERFLSTNSPD